MRRSLGLSFEVTKEEKRTGWNPCSTRMAVRLEESMKSTVRNSPTNLKLEEVGRGLKSVLCWDYSCDAGIAARN